MKKSILFQLTGSIACYKACSAISALVQKGYSVQVAATPSALQFVGEATLEGLTGRAVAKDLWETGKAMDHIHLVRQADLIIVAPATANYINSISQGLGNDLASTMALAHDFKKPFLIAPAMNTSMFLHPATQASLKRLALMGYKILEPSAGALACGESGSGRLIEPETIVRTIESLVPSTLSHSENEEQSSALKILVTAGGTQVPLDSVRAITNTSTGKTGSRIAQHLRLKGHEVCLLLSQNGHQGEFQGRTERFATVGDLEGQLKNELGQRHYDLLIHAAAVSDFGVKDWSPEGKSKKMKSDSEVTITLAPGPKLIQHAQSWSRNPDVSIVGFKLTAAASSYEQQEAIGKVFYNPGVIAVIHNDQKEITESQHRFHLWLSPDSEKASFDRIEDVIDQLLLGAKQIRGGKS